eukprot:9754368-Alexandrium_andersonii.AAC.1
MEGDLNQNADQRPLMSNPSDGTIHTLIRNTGLLWFFKKSRWACSRELFSAMGFPMKADQAVTLRRGDA